MAPPEKLRDMAAGEAGDEDTDQELLAEVSIALWRLEAIVGSDPDDRAATIVSRLQLRLRRAGYVVEDRTGQLYDPGMPLRVLGVVADRRTRKPIINQTTSPAVLRRGLILRAGEVIVANPDSSSEETS